MVRIDRGLMHARRLELGMTLDELAEIAGCDSRTVQRIEKGYHTPRLRTARGISQALGIELSSMLVVAEPPSHGPDSRDDDRIVVAFRAADRAIRAALSRDGEWDPEEMSAVLSLLLARYGSTPTNRQCPGGSRMRDRHVESEN